MNNAKKWDELVDQVRKQIDDVNTTLTGKESKATKETLAEAKRNIEQIIDQTSSPREMFYQLPLLLHSLSSQKLMAAFVVSEIGTTTLRSTHVEDFWPYLADSSTLRNDCFYRDGNLMQPDELPWARWFVEQAAEQTMQLVARLEGYPEFTMQVSIVPVEKVGGRSHVMLLFGDLSEAVKADEQVKGLFGLMEQQIKSMEAAQRELKLLVDKLHYQAMTCDSVLIPPPVPTNITVNAQSRPSTVPTPPPSPSSAGAPSSVLPKAPTEKRVLVVDDIPVNQKVLIMHLQKLGVSTDTANNGLEAVNACKSKRYSLVFMDLDMPVLNGLEATVDIRRYERPLGIHTPIVALTSFDRPGDRERCLQSGMDEFLGKGETKSQLREIVGHYVFGTSSREAAQTAAVGTPSMASTRTVEKEADFAGIAEALGKESMEVISQFIFTATTLMDQMKAVIEQRNSLQVTHVAYSLKGPCSNLGLTTMAKLCAEIADDAFLSRWAESTEKYSVLRKMFIEVQAKAGETTGTHRRIEV
jgi:CheY-like chemotaxis protein